MQKRNRLYDIGKKVLTLGFPLFMLSNAGQAQTEILPKDFLEDKSNFNFEKAENLRLNTNDSVAYKIHKIEKEGIEELRNMLGSPYYEDAWLYFPKSEMWYEVGVKSKKWEVSASNERIFSAIEKNENSDSVILYHVHPGSEDVHTANHYTPSVGDLRSLGIYNEELRERRLDKDLVGKIVSPHGVTTYKVDFSKIFGPLAEYGNELSLKKTNNSLYDSMRDSLKKIGKYSSENGGISSEYREFNSKGF